MRFTHEILEREGITHWADYGTLLGAVREADLIPWDEDVDLGALAVDTEPILSLRPEFEAAGFSFEGKERAVIQIAYSTVNRACLDIFLWEEDGDAVVADYDPSYDWPGIDAHRFPKRYLAQLESVRLGDLVLPAPGPVDRFLTEHRYGPDYMTPTRPVLRLWLRPQIPPEEMTPRVRQMLAEIAEKDHELSDLSTRSRFSKTPLSRLWQAEATPLSPPRRAKARILADIPPQERSDTVDHLAGSIAWLDRAIREFGRPTPVTLTRQLGRFGFRRGHALLARLRGKRDD